MIKRRFRRNSAASLFACISLPWLNGCATIVIGVGGPTETKFNSEPAGVDIALADGSMCTTPCTLLIDPIVEQTVTASLDDFPEQQQVLERRIAYPFWANILLGTFGIVGAAVDWFDGRIWTYKETEFTFKFAAAKPEEPAVAPLPASSLADSAALRRLKERYPEDFMLRQIRNYYGEKPPDERQRILARLYQVMLQMQEDGDRIDVDEAVRRDLSL